MKTLGPLVITCMLFSSSLRAQENQQKPAPKPKKDIIVSQDRSVPGIVNVHSLGIGLGQTFLMGDFNDLGDDEISLDLLYSYAASYTFELLVNLHYSKHDIRQTQVKIPGASVGIKGKFFQMDNFSPFLVGGLGFYRPTVKRWLNETLHESKEKITFGAHFGTGVDLRLNRNFITGIMLHYHNPFDVKQDVGPKVNGSYFKLLLTLQYTF